MKLADLKPAFLRYERDHLVHVNSLNVAQGIRFVCPTCKKRHLVTLWFADRGLPEDVEPKKRWRAVGSCIADLTLQPCVIMNGGCFWAGWISFGEVST